MLALGGGRRHERLPLQAPAGTIPFRSSGASPHASLRSVFTVIADSAAFTCRVSSRTVSNPACDSPACSHCDNGPRLKPNPIHRNAKFLQETNKSFRFARNLRLLYDLASPIHNANAREFQRDVDSDSAPRQSSISDAWGRLNVVTPFHHLSGDSHLHRSLGARAHYGI